MSNTLRTMAVGMASIAALGASFAIGTTVGRSPDQAGRSPGALTAAAAHPIVAKAPQPILSDELTSAGSCDQLLDWYVAEGVKRVGAYGWDTAVYDQLDFGIAEDSLAAGEAAPTRTSGLKSATSSATGTNVQEAGVDEPDVVKTNGTTLVRIRDDQLTTYDVSGSAPERLAAITLANIADGQILLVADRVVVLGTDDRSANPEGRARMLLIDISDAGSPEVMDERVFSSALVSATQHSSDIHIGVKPGTTGS